MSADVSHLKGTPAPPHNARLELGLSSRFAAACKDDNAVYSSEKAAAAAGLPGVPVPPTFPFVLQQVAAFPDLQPEVDWSQYPGMGAALGLLKETGGLILHGELRRLEGRLGRLDGDPSTSLGDIAVAFRRVHEFRAHVDELDSLLAELDDRARQVRAEWRRYVVEQP